jgi:hypothetical protein
MYVAHFLLTLAVCDVQIEDALDHGSAVVRLDELTQVIELKAQRFGNDNVLPPCTAKRPAFAGRFA